MIEIKMNGNGTTEENVRKCLTVLLGTREGQQALDRNFGLNWDFLDMTTAAAKARTLIKTKVTTAKTAVKPNA